MKVSIYDELRLTILSELALERDEVFARKEGQNLGKFEIDFAEEIEVSDIQGRDAQYLEIVEEYSRVGWHSSILLIELLFE